MADSKTAKQGNSGNSAKEQNALRQRLERELAFAYEKVFGKSGKRSPAQIKVLEDFGRLGFAMFPVTTNATRADNSIDPFKVAANSGKQAFLMHVQANLSLAARIQQQPAQ